MSPIADAGREVRRLETGCCIVGGGPAGVMLAYLLARAGVSVTVLEKHVDFLRDFRGDTVHPSTLEIMNDVGLLDAFLKRPHDEMDQVSAMIGGVEAKIADLRHLPTRAKFIAIMPQWDFLDFLAGEAARFPEFRLIRQAEATDLIMDGDRVVGVTALAPDGPLEVRAPLTVAADGRGSILRERAGLAVKDLGAPMDVLWMRLPRQIEDENFPLGRIEAARVFVTIARGDYFQCAYVVGKGQFEAIKAAGLDALRGDIVRLVPAFADRVGQLASWDDIKLLTVTVNRLIDWSRAGLLCIGDAAHAMSPVGGVGINLAIQDAVAAANHLWRPLVSGQVMPEDLQAVQRRREMPTWLMQGLQIFIQNRVIAPTLATNAQPKVPAPVRLLNRFAILRRIPARVLGLGFRLERVRSPNAHQP